MHEFIAWYVILINKKSALIYSWLDRDQKFAWSFK
jgi:hypothetical protein